MNADTQRVLDEIVEAHGLDLRDYRRESLVRGVATRLVATASVDVSHYLELLRSSEDELDHLLRSSLVPVTSFFRDPAVFEALRSQVLPSLFDRFGATGLRGWIAGCATGEESWSAAMVVDDAAGSRAAYDLLATDLNAGAVQFARGARYPNEAWAAVPAELRARYGVGLAAPATTTCVAPALQEHVRFAVHDLVGNRVAPVEAVVAHFHLVLCRNVLIYFDRRLQRQALLRFASVIEPGGVLVLGHVESIPRELRDVFQPEPGLERMRIFRRRVKV